jgi:hypothetical protein
VTATGCFGACRQSYRIDTACPARAKGDLTLSSGKAETLPVCHGMLAGNAASPGPQCLRCSFLDCSLSRLTSDGLYRWCHGIFCLPEPCFTVLSCPSSCPVPLFPSPAGTWHRHIRLGQRLALGRPCQTRENQKHRLLSLLQVGRDVRLLLDGTRTTHSAQSARQPSDGSSSQIIIPHTRENTHRHLSASRGAHKFPSCHLACAGYAERIPASLIVRRSTVLGSPK